MVLQKPDFSWTRVGKSKGLQVEMRQRAEKPDIPATLFFEARLGTGKSNEVKSL
jgi:hypothetical protein